MLPILLIIGILLSLYGIMLWNKENKLANATFEEEVVIPLKKEYEIKSDIEEVEDNSEKIEEENKKEIQNKEKRKSAREVIEVNSVLEEVKKEKVEVKEEEVVEEFDIKLFQPTKYMNTSEEEENEEHVDEIEARIKYHTEKYGETEIK